MKTDTTLSYGDKTLIIDTKFYSNSMSAYFGKDRYHSNNLYQIYAYVKNLANMRGRNVSGMLLYAKTDEDRTPDAEFSVSGNTFYIKTLDLSQDFSTIQKQLNDIADSLIRSATAGEGTISTTEDRP
jgi:5-methylcytosine-specific restriction enzyme subunit McrC